MPTCRSRVRLRETGLSELQKPRVSLAWLSVHGSVTAGPQVCPAIDVFGDPMGGGAGLCAGGLPGDYRSASGVHSQP